MAKKQKMRIATPLTTKERLACIHAGATGIPLETVLEKIRAATLDAPSAVLANADSSGKDGKGRAKVIATEAEEIVALYLRPSAPRITLIDSEDIIKPVRSLGCVTNRASSCSLGSNLISPSPLTMKFSCLTFAPDLDM